MNKTIYWFRKNLRIQDNPSLQKAIKDNEEVICVYFVDYSINNPYGIELGEIGSYRKKFLDECVINLEKDLKKIGITLYLFEGEFEKIIKEIKSKTNCNKLYASKEVGWYEEEEEKLISKYFNLLLYDDQNLIESDKLPYHINDLPLIFTHFRKKVEKEVDIRDLNIIDFSNKVKTNYSFKYKTKIKIADINYNKNSCYPFEGGEKNGIKRLQNYLWGSHRVRTYKETRNGMVGTEYSSKLSAYLATGCLSPVTIYHEIKKYENEVVKNSSTYWLIFEILWREFFRFVYLKSKKNIFIRDGINGNIFSKNFKNDKDLFEKWADGKTGQKFIDANMIELKETGFMSNRGRQNVASFLVNNLDINWVWGASYFEKHLIDYDVTSNWCNWMYISGVGNNVKNWVFNPERQADMYDKTGIYRDIWLKRKFGQQNIPF